MSLPNISAFLLISFIASQAAAQEHCIDAKFGTKYNIGQSWTDYQACQKFNCIPNPENGAAYTVATYCIDESKIDKKTCYKLPGPAGPFPNCCPKWTCLGGAQPKTIIQAKPPVITDINKW